MIIIGAKGFAKEVLEVLHQRNETDNIGFYDDLSVDLPDLLYDKFKILRCIEDVKMFFSKYGNKFALGVGNPLVRRQLHDVFISLGGSAISVISPYAYIGHFNNKIGSCVNIMTGTVITNDVNLSDGVLINLNCTIGHDVNVGEFVEISPGTNISGNVSIGSYTSIGTNVTVLPKVKIGKNVVVAAGSVVTKDIPDNKMVAGVPAIIKKEIAPLDEKFK